MAFVGPPKESDDVAKLYESDLAGQGYVMNLTRLWAWRPDVCVGFQQLRSDLMKGSTLTPRELAVIVCAVASNLGDSYCALAWGKRLSDAADPELAAAVLERSGSDKLSARERALVEWVPRIMANPSDTQRQEVESLRSAGFSDREIFEATTFAALRLAFSTVNDALGAAPDRQLVEAAPAAVREAVAFGRPVER